MINKWLQRLRGGSGSSPKEAPEAATAPEPPTMPAEPAPEGTLGDEGVPERAGDEPV